MEIIMPNNRDILTILKPDAFIEPNIIIGECLEEIHKITDKEVNCFDIKNWSNISSYMYEQDVQGLNNPSKVLKKRKQLLTTILGYYKLFNDKDALAMFINTNDPEYVLAYLNDFKKKLRKKYVYRTSKSFIEYKDNIEKILTSPLYDIDLDSIEYNLETFHCDSDVESDDVRNMIFFNKIHVPAEMKENDFQKKLLLRKKMLVKRDDIK